MKWLIRGIIGCVALELLAVGIGISQTSSCTNTIEGPCGPWSGGDVFVSVGNGQTQVYRNQPIEGSPNYVLIQTLNYGMPNDYTTGCTFDAQGNFYGTNFSQSKVVEFD